MDWRAIRWQSAVSWYRLLLLALALVLVALAVTGCRSDHSSPGGKKSPTQSSAPGY
jgi:hypothetical protein